MFRPLLLQHTANRERNNQCGNQHHSRQLLMMGIIMPETCLAHEKYSKIISGIYLIVYFSVISKNYPHFVACFLKNLTSPVLGQKSLKNVGVKGRHIISLPWAPVFLGPVGVRWTHTLLSCGLLSEETSLDMIIFKASNHVSY